MSAPLFPLKLDAGRVKQFNVSSPDILDARVLGNTPGSSKFLKSNNANYFAAWEQVADVDLLLSDVTANDVNTVRHGLVPKASGDSTEYLDGSGNWSRPPSGSGDVVGPVSSLDSEVALFSATSGKLIKRATGTGVAKLVSGVLSVGNIVESEITLADNTTNNFNSTKHGFVPKAPGGTTAFLREDGTWVTPAGSGDVVGPAASVASEVALFDGITGKLIKRATGSGVAKLTSGVLSVGNVVESEITLADNVTNDVSITKHGLVPKAPNDTTKFLRGDGTWAVNAGGDVSGPAASVAGEVALFDLTSGKIIKRATGTGVAKLSSGVLSAANVVESEITLSDNTTNDASTTKHGFLKKLSNIATQFLNGQGNWVVPANTPAAGTVIMLYSSEGEVTGTTSNTSAKTYSLAANSYSAIIAEAEVALDGQSNAANEVQFVMNIPSVSSKECRLAQGATGTGDFWKLTGLVKVGIAATSATTISVQANVITGAGTWTVRSLRVYGVV